jgi:hypothetical protein
MILLLRTAMSVALVDAIFVYTGGLLTAGILA